MGSLKYLAESGASAVTYYESTGWLGVLERAHGTPLPERFFSRPHGVFPLYHALADVCEWTNAAVLECSSTDPLAVVGLAVRGLNGIPRLLVANLTSRPLRVQVDGIVGPLQLRRLNERSAGVASADPAVFRVERAPAQAKGSLTLALAGHELARTRRRVLRRARATSGADHTRCSGRGFEECPVVLCVLRDAVIEASRTSVPMPAGFERSRSRVARGARRQFFRLRRGRRLPTRLHQARSLVRAPPFRTW